MTPMALWTRYAATWSLPADVRTGELKVCVADDVVYCDANRTLEGSSSLSEYMGGFQSTVPGGRFQIISVVHHHGRMLAHWNLIGPEGQNLQAGASFATAASDGRLQNISGFFALGETGP